MKMIICLVLMVGLLGCSQKAGRARWEYKIVDGENVSAGIALQATLTSFSQTNTPAEKKAAREMAESLQRGGITFFDPDLSKLGEEGWELVGVYTVTETSQARPWNSESHGDPLLPNVRTGQVRFVLKRQVL